MCIRDRFSNEISGRNHVNEAKFKTVKKAKKKPPKNEVIEVPEIEEKVIEKLKPSSPANRKQRSANAKKQQTTSKLRKELEEKNKMIKELLMKRQEELKLKSEPTVDRKKEGETRLQNYMAIWNMWSMNSPSNQPDPRKTMNSVYALDGQNCKNANIVMTNIMKKDWKCEEALKCMEHSTE
eukprot:TRINITY_DN6404_c0_g1_i3.p1 TRINITY_DN6404_c0_g1~~TRINITY_DN6404_c0_g1_i3.p1  ORF type:complete len:181 (+),score=42.94 TRINITY_DN6404_c0_g1_i3:72-614(+)